MINYKCGFIESPEYKTVKPIDYTIDVFPPTYIAQNHGDVKDQGNHNICVPCSLYTMLTYQQGLRNATYDVGEFELFKKRENTKDKSGMTVYNALSILNDMGVIVDYGKAMSSLGARISLFLDGPILVGLPVYSDGMNFWNGETLEGYHAVTLVGYEKDYFILKNSWGKYWGNKGYSRLSFDDFDKHVIECWTIIR